MNENCRKQGPQYLSRIVFVIEHSAARLSEHDISRRHESGLLTNVAEIRAQSFLSLEPGHYLTRRALTTCAESGACLRLAHQQKCKHQACATFGLCSSAHPSFVIPTGAKHSRGISSYS